MTPLRLWPRRAAHWQIRFYQLTLSALIGRQCRYLPTCSDYTDESIQKHGLWVGGWIGLSRICRCHPWGDEGYDPAPEKPRPGGRVFLPWRYGWWRRKPEAVSGIRCTGAN